MFVVITGAGTVIVNDGKAWVLGVVALTLGNKEIEGATGVAGGEGKGVCLGAPPAIHVVEECEGGGPGGFPFPGAPAGGLKVPPMEGGAVVSAALLAYFDGAAVNRRFTGAA